MFSKVLFSVCLIVTVLPLSTSSSVWGKWLSWFPCSPSRRKCSDGSYVYRNPQDRCHYHSCPNDQPVVCTALAVPCWDGSYVTADPNNNCIVPQCPPELIACTADAMSCPDGSYVGRDPLNNCAFYPCSDGNNGNDNDNGSDSDSCQCGPQLGLANTLCSDGVSFSGPTGVCQQYSDGTCGWEIRSCCPIESCGAVAFMLIACPNGETPLTACTTTPNDSACHWEVLPCA